MLAGGADLWAATVLRKSEEVHTFAQHVTLCRAIIERTSAGDEAGVVRLLKEVDDTIGGGADGAEERKPYRED